MTWQFASVHIVDKCTYPKGQTQMRYPSTWRLLVWFLHIQTSSMTYSRHLYTRTCECGFPLCVPCLCSESSQSHLHWTDGLLSGSFTASESRKVQWSTVQSLTCGVFRLIWDNELHAIYRLWPFTFGVTKSVWTLKILLVKLETCCSQVICILIH